MSAYYNENDESAAAWLRNLIAKGLIARGDVDVRSIGDVQPDDLRGYSQCHFFAGIGGWSLACRMAGLADDFPVWTGSCPCQPFSVAGKRKGESDERHLWPEFARLIDKCRPSIVFGEQVASKDGRLWLAGIRADLEAMAYAVGAADLCAAGVGAPHIRQRLYWLANSLPARRAERRTIPRDRPASGCSGDGFGLGDAYDRRCDGRQGYAIDDRASRRRTENQREPQGTSGVDSRLGNTDRDRCQSRRATAAANGYGRSTHAADWGDNWLGCPDGKRRRVEPRVPLLAHGVSARVAKLRGFGNAIVPQVAAEFVAAWMDCAP